MDLEDLYDDNNKLKVPLRRSLAENKRCSASCLKLWGCSAEVFRDGAGGGHGVYACCIYRWLDE